MTSFAIRILYATIRSLGFLTRLRVGRKWFENEKNPEQMPPLFPLPAALSGLQAHWLCLL